MVGIVKMLPNFGFQDRLSLCDSMKVEQTGVVEPLGGL